MTSLNLASNGLGEIVLAAGWRSKDNDGRDPWIGPDRQEQNEKPGKSGAESSPSRPFIYVQVDHKKQENKYRLLFLHRFYTDLQKIVSFCNVSHFRPFSEQYSLQNITNSPEVTT